MKLIVGILFVVVMLAVCSCEKRGEEEPAQTELANVELAVAACMASPDVPIRNLMTDERVGTPVFCDSRADATVKQLGLDPALNDFSLTRDVDTLLPVNPNYTGTPIQPLTDFTNTTEFDNWYCVGPEGRVTGFVSFAPFTNFRML